MSTSTEITRLTDARNLIRDKLIDLGLANSNSKLDALASSIDSIVNRGSVSATVIEGETYTIPAGYHNGSGTVSGVAGGGNYSLQSKTITPTKNQQSVTPDDGYYGLSDITVAPIPEAYQNVSAVTATASDVLTGKIIVDTAGSNIAGTMVNNGAVSKTLDATASNQTYIVPVGYHNGSGAVSIVLEQKSATPSTATQSITPTAGKVLSKVTVAPIPSAYQNVTSVDAVASEVLYGKTIVASNGAEITGSMANNGAVAVVIDTGTTSYTVPTGFHNGAGTVSLVTEQKTVTPSTAIQSIFPSSGKVLSKVTVNAIPSAYQDVTGVTAKASEVLSGKVIVAADGTEVTGSMNNRGTVSSVLSTTSTVYTIPDGYHSGSGTVSVVLEQKSATPTTSIQSIVPSNGKVLSKVTIAAIPTAYQVVTNVTASAADVLLGQVIVVSDGTEVTGEMANNGAVSKTLDTSTTAYTVPKGYHDGSGSVSIVLETKSATPSTASQNITPTAGKVLSKVTVNAIPSNFGDVTSDTVTASQILAGYKAHTLSGGAAVQVTGSMPNNGAINASIDGLTTLTYAIPSGYTTGGYVTLTSDIEQALAAI